MELYQLDNYPIDYSYIYSTINHVYIYIIYPDSVLFEDIFMEVKNTNSTAGHHPRISQERLAYGISLLQPQLGQHFKTQTPSGTKIHVGMGRT